MSQNELQAARHFRNVRVAEKQTGTFVTHITAVRCDLQSYFNGNSFINWFNGYFEWKQCEHQEFAMSSVDLVRYLTTI